MGETVSTLCMLNNNFMCDKTFIPKFDLFVHFNLHFFLFMPNLKKYFVRLEGICILHYSHFECHISFPPTHLSLTKM